MKQPPKQPSGQAQQLLTSLIENAIDFLEQSLADFEQKPKYSVIHFYAALELFLKARLVAEHWSLCVSKRQEPDWDKFVRGDFQSVTLEDAAERLEKAVRSGLATAEQRCFNEVRKHRNRMVHFFHEAGDSTDSSEQQQQIAKEQLTAWYFLHNLLVDRWEDVFQPYAERVSELDGKMRRYQSYLQVVYDNVKSEIENQRTAGLSIGVCSVCGYEAQLSESNGKVGVLWDGNCLVCELSERLLKIECPDCEKLVVTSDYTQGTCTECGHVVDPEDIAEFLAKDIVGHYEDPHSGAINGHCHNCDSNDVVVPYQDGYFCTSCFKLYEAEKIWWCEWCSEPNAGGSGEESMWSGCASCQGRAGWGNFD